jgi:lysophospholipase L1-like esterase
MTSPPPSDSDPPPPGPKRMKGERSIDFGAQLAKAQKDKVRETARLQAQRELAAKKEEPAPAADAPRESLVTAPGGPVARPAEPAPAKRRLRSKLVVLLFALGGGLVAVEIGARVLGAEPAALRGKPLGASVLAELLGPAAGEGVWKPPHRFDRATGFSLVPDYDAAEPFEEAPGGQYRIRTNGLGLRDERPLLPKASGRYRVLVLGDSRTFGVGVEREQAVPAILERALGAELGRPLDVVNAGVPGWGQREAVAFLERKCADLAPDFVILGFAVQDDVLDDLRYEEGAGDPSPDPRFGRDLAQHPFFDLPFADASRAWRLGAWHWGRPFVRYRAMREPWRLERTRALLVRARAAAAALHAKLALLVAPPAVAVQDGLAESLLHTRQVGDAIVRFAKEDGVSVYDPLPALKSARALGKRTYFGNGEHWNATGHQLVGEGVAQWLAPLVGGP